MLGILRIHKLFSISLFLFGMMFFPDLKIGIVKISELLSIFICGYHLIGVKKIKKWVLVVLLLIGYLALVLLYKSSTEILYFPDNLPILKKPFFFPFLKLLSVCLNIFLVNIFYEKLKKCNINLLEKLISSIINLSFLFTLFFIIYWVCIKIGIVNYSPNDYENSFIVYSYTYRIKGFFFEGGPLGMYIACLFILQFFISSKYKKLKLSYFFIFLIFFSQSKYGILFIFCFLAIYNFQKYKYKLNVFIIPISMLFVTIGLFIIFNISKNYIDDLRNTEYQVYTPKNDNPNFSMGRTPAVTQIIPNILKYNLFTGVGIFNYQYIRNSPKYKGFWKESLSFGDNPGMGFFFEVLYGGGLLGILLYFIAFFYLYKKNVKGKLATLFFFVFFFCQFFGTSLTFFYPWFYLLISLILSKYEDS